MIKIDKKDFDNLNKNGIFVFTTEGCRLCTDYLQDIGNQSFTENWYWVDCDEDVNYYWKEHKLDDMPQTRLYQSNDIKWEKSGLFYDFQYKELLENQKDLFKD